MLAIKVYIWVSCAALVYDFGVLMYVLWKVLQFHEQLEAFKGSLLGVGPEENTNSALSQILRAAQREVADRSERPHRTGS